MRKDGCQRHPFCYSKALFYSHHGCRCSNHEYSPSFRFVKRLALTTALTLSGMAVAHADDLNIKTMIPGVPQLMRKRRTSDRLQLHDSTS